MYTRLSSRVFNSVGAFDAFAGDVLANGGAWNKYSHHESSFGWDLNLGAKHARRLLTEGWAEGANKVKQVSLTMAQGEADGLPAFYNDVSGPIGFAQAALAGDPECYLQYDSAPLSRPVVSLAVSITCANKLESGDFIRRGAVYLTIINALEAAGMRVELYALIGTYSGSPSDKEGRVIFTAVRIKDADQDINLQALAYIIAHPAAFRRLGFAAIEKQVEDDFNGSFCHAYGSPFNGSNKEASAEITKQVLGADTILLPCFALPNNCRDSRTMLQQCAETLQQAGVLDDGQRQQLLAAA